MEELLVFLELLGTAAFAVSGAMTALRKSLDPLGVVVLGLITAVGGGVLRDLLLGITPPKIFDDPLSVSIAVAVSVAAYLPPVCRWLMRSTILFEKLLLAADSVGLGLFVVVGTQLAFQNLPEGKWFAVAFLGTVTGVGGSILRDVLVRDVPYIFRKHIYALAALAGAAVWVVCHLYWDDTAALLMGSTVVVAIRLLAAHFRWSLPKAKVPEG